MLLLVALLIFRTSRLSANSVTIKALIGMHLGCLPLKCCQAFHHFISQTVTMPSYMRKSSRDRRSFDGRRNSMLMPLILS